MKNVFKINFTLLVVIISSFSYLFVYNNGIVPSDFKLIVLFNIILHLVSFAYSIRFFKYQKIPFVFFFSLLSLITYGISPLFIKSYEFQLGEFDYSILYKLFVGFALFYLIYFLTLKWKIEISQTSINLNPIPKISYNVILNSSLLIYIVSLYFEISINGLNEYFQFITCALFLIGFLVGSNSNIQNFILVILVGYVILKILSSGMIYSLIYFTLFILTIFFRYYKKSKKHYFILFFFIGLVAIFSTLFSSVKMEYRRYAYEMNTLEEKLILMKDLISEDRVSSYESVDTKIKEGPIWRLSYPLSAISQITLMTPAIVPYWDGESYINIIYKIIPRILWENKPKENMGQVFGHRYKILNDNNLTTSMNSPIISEAYMNFGDIGFFSIFIFMAIFMTQTFFHTNNACRNKITISEYFNTIHCGFIAVYFIQWESNLSMLLGKIIILYFIQLIIKRFLFKSS